jgi:hypothetical protein
MVASAKEQTPELGKGKRNQQKPSRPARLKHTGRSTEERAYQRKEQDDQKRENRSPRNALLLLLLLELWSSSRPMNVKLEARSPGRKGREA